MTLPFIMVLAMGILFAAGIYLMLERSLTRVLLGFILLGNGVNLLIILTAGTGSPPLTDGKNLSTAGMSDPLPQALILTAIVITFAVTAFLLAMIYRSWRLVRADSLQDDAADLQVAITKMIDSEAEASTDYDDTEFGDEAESPIIGAVDLDDDGTPSERDHEDAGHEDAGHEKDHPVDDDPAEDDHGGTIHVPPKPGTTSATEGSDVTDKDARSGVTDKDARSGVTDKDARSGVTDRDARADSTDDDGDGSGGTETEEKK